MALVDRESTGVGCSRDVLGIRNELSSANIGYLLLNSFAFYFVIPFILQRESFSNHKGLLKSLKQFGKITFLDKRSQILCLVALSFSYKGCEW